MGYGGGCRCCPIALPALALCPRRELRAKIRAPRALCITGGAVNSPAQGLSGPSTCGWLSLSSAPALVSVCVCVSCVRPWVRPSTALGQQFSLPPLHVPWDYTLLPGSRPVPGPHVSGPGVSQEPRWGWGGRRECLREGTHVGFERCFMCCLRTLRQPRGAGVAVSCPDLPL